MNNFSYTPKELKGASETIANIIVAEIPVENPRHIYSDTHNRKVEELFSVEMHRQKHRRCTAVASLFVIILLIGGTVWSVVATIKRIPRSVVVSLNEEEIVYSFGTKNRILLSLRDLEILFSDSEIKTTEVKASAEMLCCNIVAGSDELDFTCMTLSEDNSICITDSNHIYEKVNISGNEADYYYDESNEGDCVLVWIDDDLNVLCFLEGCCNKERIINIAEKIILKKCPN